MATCETEQVILRSLSCYCIVDRDASATSAFRASIRCGPRRTQKTRPTASSVELAVSALMWSVSVIKHSCHCISRQASGPIDAAASTYDTHSTSKRKERSRIRLASFPSAVEVRIAPVICVLRFELCLHPTRLHAE